MSVLKFRRVPPNTIEVRMVDEKSRTQSGFESEGCSVEYYTDRQKSPTERWASTLWNPTSSTMEWCTRWRKKGRFAIADPTQLIIELESGQRFEADLWVPSKILPNWQQASFQGGSCMSPSLKDMSYPHIRRCSSELCQAVHSFIWSLTSSQRIVWHF